MVKDLGVQYGGPWFECWSVISTFYAPFYPAVTVLLEYFDPMIYNCLDFALNFVAVNAIYMHIDF